MHIAIDDTYGPIGPTKSKYVSGARRTHIAVVFSDDGVEDVRTQIRNCLELTSEYLPLPPREFHFADIYNRVGPWKLLNGHVNLGIIEAFCHIYSLYRWPVIIQTIDDRTLRDHGIKGYKGVVDGLDLSNRHDLSLMWLCIKIKLKFNKEPTPLALIVDEGQKRAERNLGSKYSTIGRAHTKDVTCHLRRNLSFRSRTYSLSALIEIPI